MSREFRFCGCVVSEMAFGERDRIVAVFTPQGLFRAIEKFGKKHNLANFSLIEGVFVEGRGELFKMKEVKVCKSFLNLRETLEAIQTALAMGETVVKSQFADKEAEGLYLIFISYLERLEKNPSAYWVSFLLKLMVHEGFWKMPEGLDDEEQKVVEVLTLSRQRSLIEEMHVDNNLKEKVENTYLTLAR